MKHTKQRKIIINVLQSCMSLIYANEKLHKVVRDLTVGEDSIVPRLRNAGKPYLALLGEESFPKEVRDLWTEVNRAFIEDMQTPNLTVERAVDMVNKILQIQFAVEMALEAKAGR